MVSFCAILKKKFPLLLSRQTPFGVMVLVFIALNCFRSLVMICVLSPTGVWNKDQPVNPCQSYTCVFPKHMPDLALIMFTSLLVFNYLFIFLWKHGFLRSLTSLHCTSS